MKKKIRINPPIFLLLIMLLFFISGCKKENNESVIVDADGNIYHSGVIGNQTWMVENLRTTKYRDGSSIANITDMLHVTDNMNLLKAGLLESCS